MGSQRMHKLLNYEARGSQNLRLAAHWSRQIASLAIEAPVRKSLPARTDSVDQFFMALAGGNVAPGAARTSGLSSDVFELYRAWCLRLGIRPLALAAFVHALRQRHRIVQGRVRYRLDGVSLGPHSVLFLGRANESIDIQVARFRACVRAYQEDDDA